MYLSRIFLFLCFCLWPSSAFACGGGYSTEASAGLFYFSAVSVIFAAVRYNDPELDRYLRIFLGTFILTLPIILGLSFLTPVIFSPVAAMGLEHFHKHRAGYWFVGVSIAALLPASFLWMGARMLC